MKKLICLSAAIFCLSSCLVGCGSKKDDSKSESSKTSTSDSAKKDDKSTDGDKSTDDDNSKDDNKSKDDDKSKDDNKSKDDDKSKDDNKSKSDVNTGDFVGKWQCKEIEMDGQKTDNFLGVDAYALFQLDIQEGGKGNVTSILLSLFSEEVAPFDIKWEKNDENSIRIEVIEPETETTADPDSTFTTEDETFILKKDGNGMVLVSEDEEEDDSKIFLEKVDSFKPLPEDSDLSFSFSTEDASIDFGDVDIETATTQKAE